MDALGLDLRSLVSPRAAAAAAAVFAALVGYALASGRVAATAADLGHAQPVWLWAAGAVFAASLFASASAWRVAFGTCGARIRPGEAAARYAIGSLVNGI